MWRGTTNGRKKRIEIQEVKCENVRKGKKESKRKVVKQGKDKTLNISSKWARRDAESREIEINTSHKTPTYEKQDREN